MLSLAWPCVRARAAKEMRGVMLVWVMVVMLLVEATVGLPSLPLTTKGNIVVDADGNRVKFAGYTKVNWYGFDSTDYVAGGLHVNTLDNIVDLIATWGFTAIRIPWSLQLWETNPVVNATFLKANPDLIGLHALDILDRVIAALAAKDILIMLDNHVSSAGWCCSNTDGNGIWFSDDYPASSFYNDWRGMVARYQNVVAVDVRNEIRCSDNNCPNWGNGDWYDWHGAAEWIGNAIHEINPNLLIVVEGLNYALDLTKVKQLPVNLSILLIMNPSYPNQFDSIKLYQTRSSTPLMTTAGTPTSTRVKISTTITSFPIGREDIVTENLAPVFLGEWGTCYTDQSCVSSQSAWMECLTSFIKDNDLDWFYWALDGTESSGAGRTWGAIESFGLTDATWSNSSWPWFLQNKLQAMQ